MAPGELEVHSAEHSSLGSCSGGGGGVLITCFTEVLDDVTLHFQIIRLHKQIYAWIGCNSAKFGNLYASAPTQPDKTSNWEGDPPGELAVPKPTQVLQRRKELSGNNTVSVTNILGGGSDNAGSGIARRIVLKTGLNVILACSIPKNSLMLEADAEKMLVQKLINLGYARPKSEGSSS